MLEVLFSAACTPFAVALGLMLALVVLELASVLIGVGLSDSVDNLMPEGLFNTASELEVQTTSVARLLGWLYVGKIPVLMVLICFLTSFGLAGWIGQSVLFQITGAMVPAFVAGPLAFAAALPLTRVSARALARVLPRDETQAVDADTFVGHTATVTLGEATADRPTEARLVDRFGQRHIVRVVPDDTGAVLRQGDSVLLVRRISASLFSAVQVSNDALIDP